MMRYLFILYLFILCLYLTLKIKNVQFAKSNNETSSSQKAAILIEVKS